MVLTVLLCSVTHSFQLQPLCIIMYSVSYPQLDPIKFQGSDLNPKPFFHRETHRNTDLKILLWLLHFDFEARRRNVANFTSLFSIVTQLVGLLFLLCVLLRASACMWTVRLLYICELVQTFRLHSVPLIWERGRSFVVVVVFPDKHTEYLTVGGVKWSYVLSITH